MYNNSIIIKGGNYMGNLKFIKDRIKEYNSNYFINELFIASKSLGILEEKIKSYKFDNILMPLLNTKALRPVERDRPGIRRNPLQRRHVPQGTVPACRYAESG